MKEKGVLLPIYALPSNYGLGDFGKEAYEFIDILSENNVAYWEILPINEGDGRPYSPVSYYAFEDCYISLDILKDYGLIDEVIPKPVTDRAVYDEEYKKFYYKKAYNKFEPHEAYYEFIKDIHLNEYAEFAAKNWGETKEYYLFLQYILYKQWIDIRKYANSKGVKIIGDMPVYPIFDSAETMFHPECFQMENGKFTFESGTPPDYFNSDGQKWDSPVYDIEYLKKTNYKYLVDRFEYYSKLFDKVRVDYFRGYDSFFKIPLGKSGKEGMYCDGVSYGFFDTLFSNNVVKPDSLIIEDLGDIREETIALRKHYGFTRQKILQYSLDLANFKDLDNESENVLLFPGNHDCDTIYGWYKTLSDENKENLKEFLRRNECYDLNVNIGIMQYCMKCKAKIVVIQAQDILGLDETTRTNIPGTISDKNWSWKLTNFEDFRREIKHFN